MNIIIPVVASRSRGRCDVKNKISTPASIYVFPFARTFDKRFYPLVPS